MDPYGYIYELESREDRRSDEVEDVARLDGYLRARAEEDMKRFEEKMREEMS